ncbi:alpha-glucosidase C-terminal domain-containing protein [Flagellimonas sp. 389]|uniref:alpha-amylase family glycosyl hydrolase n=1 Tax=Flagellimonas sp. 389 TaxID=2835862 RepID=UPI001BD6B134|nr:alpha-amylase family glycosyl hydrolase [Flagellimonas sp. 389]MBS9463321.1 alpha-glucosidase C-terminal domain-containing protein [Flagellimonas sp. 389]
MNQAALHQLISSKSKEKNPETPLNLRLATNLSLIQQSFFSIYSEEKHLDAFQKLLDLFPKLFALRPEALKQQDLKRLEEGNWYLSEKMVGMQLYVEHFNEDLKGLQEKIPYLKKLGINFLHLMPITPRPKGENDGGYAVNSYYQVDKKYGTKKDLLELAAALRKQDMFLMLDFVVNHTSNEFPWAKKAAQGNKKYQGYYYTFEDETIPKEFEKSLPEVFPETSPGNFTHIPEMDRWVMTVFNDYQWDLNYTNPEVFMEMLTNLVKLTNMGIDLVRFDALAFLWKKIGTDSQNLPEAHNLITLFRMCLQVIAPGTIFLAEAIVAPTEIIKYFGEDQKEGNECEVAYNASLMALLWNSIATKKTNLLYRSLTNIPAKPKDCTWINYIRCHDDIGLGYDDRFIEAMGWNPQQHRKFLLDYYCQRLDWSPARGLLFMHNPKTGDGRITGSAASLLGLEKGLDKKDDALIQEALSKIIMLHGIILSFGGIPMIYAGDEIGTLNDYSFLKDDSKREDSRWVNRPQQDWEIIAEVEKKGLPQSKIFLALQKLIALRKENPVFADGNSFALCYTGNDHILAFERTDNLKNGLLVICNFDENPQVVEASWILKLGYFAKGEPKDLVSDEKVFLKSGLLELMPYQILWLKKS